MLRKIKILLVASMLVISGLTFADGDHALTDIIGNNIELKSYDHTVAGSIKDFTIWGSMACKDSYSELIMKKDGQTIKTHFQKRQDGKYAGTITHTVKDIQYTTELSLKGINKDDHQILLLLNGEELLVQLSADDFDGEHFINPRFTTNFNGEDVSFKMMNGEACFGLSAKTAMVILGAYFHGTN